MKSLPLIFLLIFQEELHIYHYMKKSDLRKMIRECIQSVLTEAQLMKAFAEFTKREVPAMLQDDFFNLFQRAFLKTAEDPQQQQRYIQTVIDAAIGKPIDQSTKERLKADGIDVDDKRIRLLLNKLHPFLSKFKSHVSTV